MGTSPGHHTIPSQREMRYVCNYCVNEVLSLTCRLCRVIGKSDVNGLVSTTLDIFKNLNFNKFQMRYESEVLKNCNSI